MLHSKNMPRYDLQTAEGQWHCKSHIKKLLLKGRISETRLLRIKKNLCREKAGQTCHILEDSTDGVSLYQGEGGGRKRLWLNRFQHNLVQEEHNLIWVSVCCEDSVERHTWRLFFWGLSTSPLFKTTTLRKSQKSCQFLKQKGLKELGWHTISTQQPRHSLFRQI
jgi:hypothetical protein